MHPYISGCTECWLVRQQCWLAGYRLRAHGYRLRAHGYRLRAHLFTMSLTYTTTNILCAATDVGMHGLLASQSCYHSVLTPSLCTLWTSSRFLHY